MVAVPGILLGLTGYVGCWLALKAIRRKEIAAAGQLWLRLVVIWIPVSAAGVLEAILVGNELHDYGKGSVFITMIRPRFLSRQVRRTAEPPWLIGLKLA